MAPPERQYERDNRSDSASNGDDRRRGNHLGRGPGRYESGPLANDHTIIITAASKSRPSFGCGADRDLTYFGEAFWRDALPGAPNLRAAFETARREITAREKDERQRPSHPQGFFGPLMESKLAELEVGSIAGR